MAEAAPTIAEAIITLAPTIAPTIAPTVAATMAPTVLVTTAATTTATLLARGHTPSLLPDVYDESIQAACILLPVLSLLITLGRRSWLRFTGSNATEAGGRTGADVEGGDTGELMRASSKGSMTQLQANKKEEEEIKLRAAQKANGS